MASRSVVIAAQKLLSAVNPRLVADGWWGTFTNAAYLKAPPNTRQAVDALLAQYNSSAGQLLAATRTARVRENSTPGAVWISVDLAHSLIDRYSPATGFSPVVFRQFLDLEAARRKAPSGEIEYNAASVSPNGLFRGLYQMGAPAWSDVQKWLPDKANYSKVFDPALNTLAAMLYARQNVLTARSLRYKGPITAEVLYAMHNQGAAGFVRLVGKTDAAVKAVPTVANQSTDAVRMILAAVAQNRTA